MIGNYTATPSQFWRTPTGAPIRDVYDPAFARASGRPGRPHGHHHAGLGRPGRPRAPTPDDQPSRPAGHQPPPSRVPGHHRRHRGVTLVDATRAIGGPNGEWVATKPSPTAGPASCVRRTPSTSTSSASTSSPRRSTSASPTAPAGSPPGRCRSDTPSRVAAVVRLGPATGPRAGTTTGRGRVPWPPPPAFRPFVDDLLTASRTITGVERPTWPLVLITEPGRTPLQLLVHRPRHRSGRRRPAPRRQRAPSRRHLSLSATAGRLVVTDLGSTNGTQLDGIELREPDPEARAGRHLREVPPSSWSTLSATRPSTSTTVSGAGRWHRHRRGGGRPDALHPLRGRDLDHRLLRRGSTRRTEELGDAGCGCGCWGCTTASSAARWSATAAMRSRHRATASCWPSQRPRRRAVRHRRPTHARRPRALAARRSDAGPHRHAHRGGHGRGRQPVRALGDPSLTRIADQARGRGILVSSLVREIVKSRGDLAFGPCREVSLKGLSGAHRLHPILWEDRHG